MSENFSFFLEADIAKSTDTEERRIIRGYASTEAQDRQGESLVQKGLDISDFVNHGYFNYDHDNSIILGYPIGDKCQVDDQGFWVEGELFKGIPEADRIWNLALAIKKSRAPRKVGFSIEGKVLKRDGGRILKAKIYNVAITTNPVNTTCSWEAVVKSFNGVSEEDVILNKSLEAGYEVDPTKMTGGGVFRKEDLEDDLHNLSYVIDNEENKKILKQKLSTKKSLTGAELTLYLQLTKGWSRAECQDFLKRIQ
jgi:hypothetical protein